MRRELLYQPDRRSEPYTEAEYEEAVRARIHHVMRNTHGAECTRCGGDVLDVFLKTAADHLDAKHNGVTGVLCLSDCTGLVMEYTTHTNVICPHCSKVLEFLLGWRATLFRSRNITPPEDPHEA